jgi:probable rRNA maturation factor
MNDGASSRRLLQSLEMDLAITNRQRTRKINLLLLKNITGTLLTELELGEAEIGICLVGAREITRLNETFLHHAGVTDVIAFDYHDNVLPASCRQGKSELPAGCRKHVHGEIFVCVDEAIRQARRFGTSWQSEVIRCLIHGVLHLLGFDDRRVNARRKMKREENRLLREITRRFPLSKL